MTYQTQIIILCSIAAVATPLATFVAIKTIKKIWRAPVNVLRRDTADIELVDYISPSQPLNTYYPNQFDLVNHQIPVLERISLVLTNQNSISPPSYQSEILPSYQSANGYYIHCCLENENMNIYFIFVITIFLTLYLFNKAKKQNVNFIRVINWNFDWVLILFSWFSCEKYSNIILFSLPPFSLFEIDFRDSFDWEINSYRDKPKISYLSIQTLTEDITKLLNSLNIDSNYSMSLSYISSYKIWKDNKEKVVPLFIDNPIIINKESDPILITQFIMNNEKCDFLTDWLFKDSLINSMDSVIITVTTPIKVKIY